MVATTSETLWERLVGPAERGMTADVARFLLTREFSPSDIDRMDALAGKARRGALTAEEDAELETYIRVGNRLAILKSKARMFLKSAEGGA